MEKNAKVKRKSDKKEEKKNEDIKKYKKKTDKGKENSETKENGGKKHFQTASQHQLKKKISSRKIQNKTYQKEENDHQTMDLGSDDTDEDEEDVVSEEEDIKFVTKKSNKLSKAPKHIRSLFSEEANEAEDETGSDGDETSDEETDPITTGKQKDIHGRT